MSDLKMSTTAPEKLDEGASRDLSTMDFAALVADIQKNPELMNDPSVVSDDMLPYIQKQMNPYAFSPVPPPAKGMLNAVAASCTNLREEYIRRFTMTSLAGFMHQVLHEWEVPAAARRWTPKKRTDQEPIFDPSQLVDRIENVLEIAKAARAARADFDAADLAARQEDAAAGAGVTGIESKMPGTASQDAQNYKAATETRAAGLLFAATEAVRRIGIDAEKRLDATIIHGRKFPEVRVEMDKSDTRPGQTSQMEMPPAQAKLIIEGFMKHWLQFDPSVHVRSAHDAKAVEAALVVDEKTGQVVDSGDPTRMPLDQVLAAPPPPAEEDRAACKILQASKSARDAATCALRDSEVAAALSEALATDESRARFRRYLYPVPVDSPARDAAEHIPPRDTFHRWAYYTEVNYEQLRTIVEAVYHDKPDLDWMIGIWDHWEGTEAAVSAKFDEFSSRHEDNAPGALKLIPLTQWTFLGDFKKNRENIRIHNSHTVALNRITERGIEDAKLGADLMRKRVFTKKAENIRDAGPDAPGLNAYRKNQPNTLAAMGTERVISPLDMRRLERARGDVKAAKELEVFDEIESKIKQYAAIEATRPLSAVEKDGLAAEQQRRARALEMLAVPEDAIQVDVFAHDGKTGSFAKSHFYTQAEEPEAMPRPDGGAPKLAPFALDLLAKERAEEMKKLQAGSSSKTDRKDRKSEMLE